MNHIGHQLFSGTTLSLDQNRGTAGADAVDNFIYLLHLRALADQLIKAEPVFEPLPDLNVLQKQLAFFDDSFNQDFKSFKIYRLLKIVVTTQLERLDGRFNSAVAGYDNDFRGGIRSFNRSKQIKPADFRHDKVGENNRVVFLLDPFNGDVAVIGCLDMVAES